MEILRFTLAFFFVCCLFHQIEAGPQFAKDGNVDFKNKTFSATSDEPVSKDTDANSTKDLIQPSDNNKSTDVNPGPDNKKTDSDKIADVNNAVTPINTTPSTTPAISEPNTDVTPKLPSSSTTTTTTITPPSTTTTTTTTPPSTPKTTTIAPPSTTTTSAVNPTSTKEPPLPNSTEHPITPASTTPKSRFDGPSFVGGIVLTVGLVAMGFIGFKYYKTRTDSYHTL